MPKLDSIIKDVVGGNTLLIMRVLQKIPAGEHLTDAWFTIKKRKDDDDTSSVIDKAITTTPSDVGQITDDGTTTPGQGAVKFFLTEADTLKLKENQKWYFSIKFKTDGSPNTINTPELGIITVKDPVRVSST